MLPIPACTFWFWSSMVNSCLICLISSMVNPCLDTSDNALQKVLAMNGILLQDWQGICILFALKTVHGTHHAHILWNPNCTIILDTVPHDRLKSCISLLSHSSVLQYHMFHCCTCSHGSVTGCHLPDAEFYTLFCYILSVHHTVYIYFHLLVMNFWSWRLLCIQIHITAWTAASVSSSPLTDGCCLDVAAIWHDVANDKNGKFWNHTH